MHLTPREQDKLMIFVASELAKKRRARGLKLNYPEAMAILSAEILEAARDGKSVSDIMSLGASILDARGRHGWHRGDDSRSASGSDISRRHQAGDRSRPHSIGEQLCILANTFSMTAKWN